MLFESVDLNDVYRTAVVRPAEPSAARAYGKAALSPIEIAALRQNLTNVLENIKRLRKGLFFETSRFDRHYRTLEAQIRSDALRVADPADRESLYNRIEELERTLPEALQVISLQADNVKRHSIAQGPIGKAINREEKKILERLTSFYDGSVQHYYFLLSVRAENELSETADVASSPADIDRLFA